MPTIRIDEEVYEALKKDAEPFIDTPNSVLRRVLKLDEVAVEAGTSRRPASPPSTAGWRRRKYGRRVPSDQLMPIGDYKSPILAVLSHAGGEGYSTEVAEKVYAMVESKLKPADRESIDQSDTPRWRSRLNWAKQQLVENGQIEAGTPRGVWRLTQAGHLEDSRPVPRHDPLPVVMREGIAPNVLNDAEDSVGRGRL